MSDLVKLVHTRHQVPRGTMPDAIVNNRMYLLKYASTLRATYQIRLLAFRAVSEGTKVIIIVPPHCKLQKDLVALRKMIPRHLQIERKETK